MRNLQFILFFVLLSCFNSGFANGRVKCDIESTKRQIERLRIEKLKGFEIGHSVEIEIDKIMLTAEDSLKEDNCDIIIKNFSIYIDEIVVHSQRKMGFSGEKVLRITRQSIVKARKSICPLYPFCKKK